MHFIKVTKKFFDEKKHFSGSVLEVVPLIPAGQEVNIAFYQEIWHRLRRDQYLQAVKKNRLSSSFDAILYFSPSDTGDNLCANIIVNTAENEHHCPDPENAEKNAKAMLQRLDALLCELNEKGEHDTALLDIAKRFDTEPSAARADLKALLKIFCRSQGLFINAADVEHAIVSEKNRRRELWQKEHSR